MARLIIHQKGDVEVAILKTSFRIGHCKYHMEGEVLGGEVGAEVDMGGGGGGEGDGDSDSFVCYECKIEK